MNHRFMSSIPRRFLTTLGVFNSQNKRVKKEKSGSRLQPEKRNKENCSKYAIIVKTEHYKHCCQLFGSKFSFKQNSLQIESCVFQIKGTFLSAFQRKYCIQH